jgi:hypothetical protein
MTRTNTVDATKIECIVTSSQVTTYDINQKKKKTPIAMKQSFLFVTSKIKLFTNNIHFCV